MKNVFIAVSMLIFFTMNSTAQEYKIVTTVESVVPMGIGRSRIIETTDTLSVDNFTTARTDGKKE